MKQLTISTKRGELTHLAECAAASRPFTLPLISAVPLSSPPRQSYGFFGLAQPKILSKNRPDIRVRNHQLENRRDCMILAPNFLSNGIIVGPIIGSVERIAPSERLLRVNLDPPLPSRRAGITLPPWPRT